MQWLMFVLGCGEKDLDTGVEEPIEDTSPEEELEEEADGERLSVPDHGSGNICGQ